MQTLQIFTHSNFGDIDTMEIDGKVYFAATRAAKILGYKQPAKAIREHCKTPLSEMDTRVQTGIKTDDTPAFQVVKTKFIPEGDLYRLIIRSKLPAAEKFERWVFDEVIPQIRQSGSYRAGGGYITLEDLRQFIPLLFKEFAALIEPIATELAKSMAAASPPPAASVPIVEYEKSPDSIINEAQNNILEYPMCGINRSCPAGAMSIFCIPVPLLTEVDRMLNAMEMENNLSYSHIKRLLKIKGFSVTDAALRKYNNNRVRNQYI